MDNLTQIQGLTVLIIPILFAVTVHEVAHGWVAKQLGDDTAFILGRLTLNPLKHIDLFGTVIVPSLLFISGGILFGWAKPVPVDWRKLSRPKQDMIWVALAGPGANLLMAIGWALLAKLAIWVSLPYFSVPLQYMASAGIWFNLMLMAINLIPIPPLDGGRVLTGLLPTPLAVSFSKLEPYGLIIILILIATGLITAILGPLIVINNTFISIFGL